MCGIYTASILKVTQAQLVSKVWGWKCEGKRAAGRPRWLYPNQEAVARGGLRREEALERDWWKSKVRQIGKPQ